MHALEKVVGNKSFSYLLSKCQILILVAFGYEEGLLSVLVLHAQSHRDASSLQAFCRTHLANID